MELEPLGRRINPVLGVPRPGDLANRLAGAGRIADAAATLCGDA